MLDLFLFFLVGIKKWRIFESDFHGFHKYRGIWKKEEEEVTNKIVNIILIIWSSRSFIIYAYQLIRRDHWKGSLSYKLVKLMKSPINNKWGVKNLQSMIIPATHRPDFVLIAGRPCMSTVPSRVHASWSSLNLPCKFLGKIKTKSIEIEIIYSRCDHYHHTTLL